VVVILAWLLLKEKLRKIQLVGAKSCPNCKEPNKPDTKFCAKCRMVLTYDGYSETLESEKQKDDRVSVLENQMQSLVSTLSKLTGQGQVNAVAQTLYSSGINTLVLIMTAIMEAIDMYKTTRSLLLNEGEYVAPFEVKNEK
jgi:predicted amidophosphoribosyltransferase